tara:strand:- start:349 stop:594 length:246 start_codon:yes stop_codon:yes gene_type:complete
MIEKLKSIFTAMGAMLPRPQTKAEEGFDEDPDYRYGDFRDEIRDVERMRTITTGGKNGQKENKEKSKEESNTPSKNQERAW